MILTPIDRDEITQIIHETYPIRNVACHKPVHVAVIRLSLYGDRNSFEEANHLNTSHAHLPAPLTARLKQGGLSTVSEWGRTSYPSGPLLCVSERTLTLIYVQVPVNQAFAHVTPPGMGLLYAHLAENASTIFTPVQSITDHLLTVLSE